MAFMIAEAEEKGYRLDEVIRSLRNMMEKERITMYRIKVMRNRCCYSLWSNKGMMRIGLDLDKPPLALALLILS